MLVIFVSFSSFLFCLHISTLLHTTYLLTPTVSMAGMPPLMETLLHLQEITSKAKYHCRCNRTLKCHVKRCTLSHPLPDYANILKIDVHYRFFIKNNSLPNTIRYAPTGVGSGNSMPLFFYLLLMLSFHFWVMLHYLTLSS